MNLDGRRESTNVDDRRGMGRGAKAGVGLGGTIVIALIVMLLGGDPSSVLEGVSSIQGTEQTEGHVGFSAEEQELASFTKKVLAGTEDVWTAIFAKYGYEYDPPKMVLYSGSTTSGCGAANSSVGPFYCSADQSVYIDLSFFSKTEANAISVRLELQADYYAGVWAMNDDKKYKSLEKGDIENALNCASKIGDDYLQKKAQGYVVTESFTHGTAKQRYTWLKRGLEYGDLEHGDTFSVAASKL